MDPIMVMIAALRGVLGGSDPAAAVEQAKGLLDEFGKMGGVEPDGDEPPGAAADPNAPPGPGMPARAADCPPEKAARVAAQRGAAERPITLADVQRDIQRGIREENAKRDLLVTARASRIGLTDKLEAHLATRPLAEVRQVVDALEVKPTDAKPVPRAALAVGAEAGSVEAPEAEASPPTPEEAETIRKMNNAFGNRAAAPTVAAGVWDVSRLKAAKAAKALPAASTAAK